MSKKTILSSLKVFGVIAISAFSLPFVAFSCNEKTETSGANSKTIVTTNKPESESEVHVADQDHKHIELVSSTSWNANYQLDEKSHGVKGSSFPNLSWKPVAGAKSYAIQIEDKWAVSAVGTPFIHFLGITKSDITSLEAGISPEKQRELMYVFDNSQSKKVSNSIVPAPFQSDSASQYFGPFPPDQDHVYTVNVYALGKSYSETELQKLLGKVPAEKVATQADTVTTSTQTEITDQEAKQAQSAFLWGFQSDFQKVLQDAKVLSWTENNFIGRQSGAEVGTDKKPGFVNESFQLSGSFYQDPEEIELIEEISSPQIDASSHNLAKNLLTTFKSDDKTWTLPESDFQIQFEKQPEAKSYVVLMINSAQTSSWGVPVVNFVSYGIANPESSDQVIVKINGKDAISGQSFGYNSYNQTNAAFKNLVAEKLGLSKRESQKTILDSTKLPKGNFVLVDHGTDSAVDGIYSIYVYGTSLESSDARLSDLTKEGKKPSAADVLKAIHGKVLSEGKLDFKIEKAMDVKKEEQSSQTNQTSSTSSTSS